MSASAVGGSPLSGFRIHRLLRFHSTTSLSFGRHPAKDCSFAIQIGKVADTKRCPARDVEVFLPDLPRIEGPSNFVHASIGFGMVLPGARCISSSGERHSERKRSWRLTSFRWTKCHLGMVEQRTYPFKEALRRAARCVEQGVCASGTRAMHELQLPQLPYRRASGSRVRR